MCNKCCNLFYCSIYHILLHTLKICRQHVCCVLIESTGLPWWSILLMSLGGFFIGCVALARFLSASPFSAVSNTSFALPRSPMFAGLRYWRRRITVLFRHARFVPRKRVEPVGPGIWVDYSRWPFRGLPSRQKIAVHRTDPYFSSRLPVSYYIQHLT